MVLRLKDKQMYKQMIKYSWNVLLLINKENEVLIHNNMDESQKHFTE
jgi:hypothetical protein